MHKRLWGMHRLIRIHEVQMPCCNTRTVLQQTRTVTDVVRQACHTAPVPYCACLTHDL